MKIKKHGKKFSKSTIAGEMFECESCGCEFEAKSDEYYIDYGYEIGCTSTITLNSISNRTIIDYLICSCPECYKIVKKSCERRIPNYTFGCASSSIYTSNGESPVNTHETTITLDSSEEKKNEKQ